MTSTSKGDTQTAVCTIVRAVSTLDEHACGSAGQVFDFPHGKLWPGWGALLATRLGIALQAQPTESAELMRQIDRSRCWRNEVPSWFFILMHLSCAHRASIQHFGSKLIQLDSIRSGKPRGVGCC